MTATWKDAAHNKPATRFFSVANLVVPLWLPCLAIAIPTTFLWYLDRFRKTGCRNCGYSLEGLTAASACPECGTAPPTVKDLTREGFP